MATYKKPTIEVNGTTLMGENFSGDANTYEALKAHKTVKAKVDDKDALIPFHAVKDFTKSVVTEDAERTDPYCGGGTEPIGEVWAVSPEGNDWMKIHINGSGVTGDGSTTKTLAEWLDLVNNHQNYAVSVRATFPTVDAFEHEVPFTDFGWSLERATAGNYEVILVAVSGDEGEITAQIQSVEYYDESTEFAEKATKTEIIVTKK